MEKDLKVYDAERLARFFGVTAETVQEWCRRGKLPAFEVGRDWKVRVVDLQKMIERKVRGGEEPFSSAQGLF
jgi:excisionase family DNA binding protein